MDTQNAVAEKLLQINAIKLSVRNPFTWASGWESPIYCDNRRALSFPETRDLIKRGMSKMVSDHFPDTEVVAGVATAGIAWGVLIADELQLPFIYVRSKPKDHGLQNQIEGYAVKDSKVVIIEDLISTGKSSLQVVEVLRSRELRIQGLISIFNYGFESAAVAFSKAGIETFSLTGYDSLVARAIDKKYISKEDQNTLLNWRKDPENWQSII
jgi:orotate phosphoribosyltransferase